MFKKEKKKQKKKIGKSGDYIYSERVIRFFGIPIYSSVICLNWEEMYKKMEERFFRKLNAGLEKRMSGSDIEDKDK